MCLCFHWWSRRMITWGQKRNKRSEELKRFWEFFLAWMLGFLFLTKIKKDINFICSRMIMISDDDQDDKIRWYLEDFNMIILQN